MHGMFDNADAMGSAFAFGEMMSGEEREQAELNHIEEEILEKEFDVDENTDAENWEKAMRLTSLSSRHSYRKALRPFEQYVDDICKGRMPLFDNDPGFDEDDEDPYP
jgi:hypothetical protein